MRIVLTESFKRIGSSERLVRGSGFTRARATEILLRLESDMKGVALTMMLSVFIRFLDSKG